MMMIMRSRLNSERGKGRGYRGCSCLWKGLKLTYYQGINPQQHENELIVRMDTSWILVATYISKSRCFNSIFVLLTSMATVGTVHFGNINYPIGWYMRWGWGWGTLADFSKVVGKTMILDQYNLHYFLWCVVVIVVVVPRIK